MSLDRNSVAFPLLAAGVIALGRLGSHGIYASFVVPRLGTVNSVPTAWWLAVFAPLAFAGALMGWRLRGWTQGLSSVLISAVLVQAVHVCLALAEQPGYVKAGIEDALAGRALLLRS